MDMLRRLSVCILAGLLAAAVWLVYPPAVRGQGEAPLALWLTVDGPLTAPVAGYLERGIRTAEQRGAEVVILQLNTPGGSITIMNQMVQDILASPVPVIVYVAPRGAMAGSAGTIVTLAGHAAAMAPETAIGAASPVGGGGQDLDETSAAKEKNILKATVRSLAGRRGSQAVLLAEETIESAQAASAEEALSAGMIDFIASDTNELLRQLDGFRVAVSGAERVLHTAGAIPTPLPVSFVEGLLGMLTDPNIVFLLINIGVAAVLIEIASPGGWLAGFIGVACLALATYGLGVLPVNWFGIVFLLVAFVLFILDIKAPTHGALTAAGVGSLILGALVLFNTPDIPGFPRVSVPLVIGSSLVTGGMFLVILLFALRAQNIPVRMGQESLAGKVGAARTELAPRGIVHLEGEDWSAELPAGAEPVHAGERVQVLHVDGLRLIVKKVGE